ncbi:MAG: hypothetical protein M1831_001555 [Alyxoria varia]|nr:MAG: hypothetical protein M1831_001555 [Alyxoria varia]
MGCCDRISLPLIPPTRVVGRAKESKEIVKILFYSRQKFLSLLGLQDQIQSNSSIQGPKEAGYGSAGDRHSEPSMPIENYKKELQVQQRRYKSALVTPKQTGFDIALEFRAWQIMSEQFKNPGSLLIYDTLGPETKLGLRGAHRWQLEAHNLAGAEMDPARVNDPTGKKWTDKQAEYLEFSRKLATDRGAQQSYIEDKAHGLGYFIRENAAFPKMWALIGDELVAWANNQPATKTFLSMRVEIGYATFLSERKDVIALLRVAKKLPLDVEHMAINMPTVTDVAEFIIGLLPFVGNMVAASGQRIVLDPKRFTTITNAEALTKASITLDKTLADDVVKIAADLLKDGGGAVGRTVDPSVTDALRKLHQVSRSFGSLDELAMERILLKGPHVNHLKGQMLEELLESRIVPWLRDRWGNLALTLEVPAGKKIEFIPGFAIRDLNQAAITDGIIGFQDGGKFNIVAVFECKAGPSGARELSYMKGTLTEEEKLELRAAAKDELFHLREEAALNGRPFKTTLEQIMTQYKTAQLGGQIQRDIERLSTQGAIWMGRVKMPIVFSPTKTKFFGVIPAGMQASVTSRIISQLQAEKFSFELIAAEVTTADLDNGATQLVDLARAFANADVPPRGVPPAPMYLAPLPQKP